MNGAGLPAGMMDVPLNVTHFIERAGTLHADKEVATWEDGGAITRTSWREVDRRVRTLVGALREMGVRPGDRVASLAWNRQPHLELYFAVPAAGAVLQALNARLAPAQLAGILAHGDPAAIFADPELVALAEDALSLLAPSTSAAVRRVVLGTSADEGRPRWIPYSQLLEEATAVDVLPRWSEHTACGLCYTSGTTGEPKGVLYSHRALVLHTLAICLPDAFGLAESDVILPVVPMFHANGWGLPHAAAMTGARLVLPGSRPSPAGVARLLRAEGVTFAAGVPTIWMEVLEELRASGGGPLAEGLRIHSGGAPTPPSLIDAWARELGVELLTGWGMTELSPVGMVTRVRSTLHDAPPERLRAVRSSQGRPLPLVEIRIIDAEGRPCPPDGQTAGELQVRGPWVTGGYFGRDDPSAFHDGWLRTGDVATVDADGYVRLVDRSKDLIRSGGEWISSVALEHALMDQPGVSEAAVVAVPHPKWQERPLACVVPAPGAAPEPDALLAPLRDVFPAWWLPDAVVFMAALPRTATGKVDKRALRRRFASSRVPDEPPGGAGPR